MTLKNKKVLVGMTGGIAAYKIPYLIRQLIQAGAEVRVVMTDSATKFITPLTLETISGHPVATAMFPDNDFVSTRHIDFAVWPDLIVVAPATANFFAKVASGICDDLLTTIICATVAPVIVVPAMNPGMWQHVVTQKNVGLLKELGYGIVGPATGAMACDAWGEGRMVEPSEILDAVKAFAVPAAKKKAQKEPQENNALKGRQVLVTAGPCREPIDPVRYLSNHSSGKMGYALARAAAAMGAETILVSGPCSLDAPPGVELIAVETTAQMYAAVSRRFSRLDCLIMAAAPADYTPVAVAGEKIKKQSADFRLEMKPTVDILAALAPKKKKQIVIGFALETENGVANARKKLKQKNLDLIVLNSPRDAQSAFGHDTNQVTLIRPGRKPDAWPLMTKAEVASKLLENVASMW